MRLNRTSHSQLKSPPPDRAHCMPDTMKGNHEAEKDLRHYLLEPARSLRTPNIILTASQHIGSPALCCPAQKAGSTLPWASLTCVRLYCTFFIARFGTF